MALVDVLGKFAPTTTLVFKDNMLSGGKKISEHISGVIIAGQSNDGRDSALEFIIKGNLYGGTAPVVVLQNGNTCSRHLMDRFKIECPEYCQVLDLINNEYSLDLRYFTDDKDLNTDLYVSLLQNLVGIENKSKRFHETYIEVVQEIIEKFRDPSLKLNLWNLKQFDGDWISRKVANLKKKGLITPSEELYYTNFVDEEIPVYASDYMDFLRLGRALERFDTSKFMSGTMTIDEMMKIPSLYNIVLDPNSKEGLSTLVLNHLLSGLTKYVSTKGSAVTLVIEGVDVKNVDTFKNTMSAFYSAPNCNLVLVDEDISAFHEDAKWNPESYANLFIVFNQNNPNNRDFWSQMIGMHRVKKYTTSYSKKYGILNVPSGATEDYEDRPIVEPIEFGKLSTYDSVLIVTGRGKEVYHINMSWR